VAEAVKAEVRNHALGRIAGADQKTITETTGLLKRLHELSISIAEKQQRQLDGVGTWQATAER
jgi:hypothetical protein